MVTPVQRRWRGSLASCALAAIALGAPARADADETLRVVVSAGAEAPLARADCGEPRPVAPGELAKAVGRIDSALEGVPLGFAFDGGGLLAPHAVTRQAMSAAPAALAALVEGLGYDALALGEDDLRAPLDDWVRLAAALRERGIPVLASNLRCAEAARAVCDALVTAEDGVPLFRLGGLEVALLAYLAPSALDHVAPERARSLALSPIEESVALGARRARALGADVVIVSIDDGEGAAAFGRALSIASGLEPGARPDFIVSARGGSEAMFARPIAGEPAVIAPPRGRLAEVDVLAAGASGAPDLRARMLAPASAPHRAVLEWIDAEGPRYCREWGADLPGGALTRPLDEGALRALAARVAKAATDADLVVLPKDAFGARFSPMRAGALSRGDLEVALTADAPLVTAEVSGKWLTSLAKSMNAAGEPPSALGLEVVDAGRPGERVTLFDAKVESDGVYRVVTTLAFARRGGPALPAGARFEPTGETLRSALLEHVGEARPRDPRDAIDDPAATVEWYGRLMADANFGGTVVRNPGGYEESQLDRKDSLAVGVTSQSDFGATSRRFGWENRFDLRYRIIRDEAQGTVEGDDFISLISRAKWLGLRADSPKVYVPEPFAEVYVESEFTEGPARDYHHLLVRPALGAVFRLMEPVLLSVRGGFQFEALDPSRAVEPGLGFRLEAASLEVLAQGDNKLLLRGFVDYFWSSLGRRDTHTLRSTVDVSFSLGKRFGVGVLVVVFGLRDEGRPFSVATNATAFLRASFFGRRR